VAHSVQHAGGELTTQEVQYRRGLFQGDALSPLLFCLSVTPLSYGLRNTTGYPARFLTNPATHLMFVDDLKVYASGAKALGQSLKVVERITTAIGMKIGAQKCATTCLRKRKRTEASDYSITEDVIKALVDGQTYKYLGIHQTIRSDPEKVRRALGEVYKRRLHQIWKAQMSGRNKIHATNIWAVSLFRYYFSSPLKWTKISLRDLDRATRAILRKHRGHYKGACLCGAVVSQK